MTNSAHNGYEDFLRYLKKRIHSARMRAALAVNRELVLLYWQVGRNILVRQEREGWGTLSGQIRLDSRAADKPKGESQ